MLYIEATINGHRIQAFVDSGAETSVMSAACAKKCDLFDLIDEDFAGKVVGVGSGNTLGKIHSAPMQIANNFFPMSITVMDDSKGFGDQHMKFLIGLDMLKRFRCQIDLAEGCLWFHGATGRVAAPFLHEKDLPKSKGVRFFCSALREEGILLHETFHWQFRESRKKRTTTCSPCRRAHRVLRQRSSLMRRLLLRRFPQTCPVS